MLYAYYDRLLHGLAELVVVGQNALKDTVLTL